MKIKETSMQWSRRSKNGGWYKYSSIEYPASFKLDFRPGCWFIIPHSRTETPRMRATFRRLGIKRVRNNLCRSL